MITLRPKPLDAASFAPFGEVISAQRSGGKDANQGTAVRFDRITPLVNKREHATANVAVFRSAPVALPFRINLLEQHPFSTQMFLPLVCSTFLVIVAPALKGEMANNGPDTSQMQVFRCMPGQGINYHVGVWHHPILALESPAEFAMLAWEDGGAGDCVEQTLTGEFVVIEV